jgi:uncharacterized protein YuzE
MEQKHLRIWFDPEGDVLEVGFARPQKGFFKDVGDDIFVRVDQRGNVSGFAILNATKRTNKIRETTGQSLILKSLGKLSKKESNLRKRFWFTSRPLSVLRNKFWFCETKVEMLSHHLTPARRRDRLGFGSLVDFGRPAQPALMRLLVAMLQGRCPF